MPPIDLQPSLNGALLELRPLRAADFDDLFAVAADPLIWEQHPARDRCEEDQFRAFFREALESGGALVAIDTRDARIIGSSRYHGYDPERSEIEIGWTFLARTHWGGRYNAEMKRLMLRHAFRHVERVVFLVGSQNVRSQRAVEKIGGVRVDSRFDASGRESVVYVITASAYGSRRRAEGLGPAAWSRDTTSRNAVTPRSLMSTSAIVLGIAGLALLFAPVELQRLVPPSSPAPVPPMVLQLWGAALLGLAATNWVGRGLILGGIYGRALVMGNAMHWTVGSLVGVRAVLDHPTSAGAWAAAALYGVFALAFTWLLRRHPLPVPPPTPPPPPPPPTPPPPPPPPTPPPVEVPEL
jgi:RimJ/RimL family protein N-acetyltransferase